MKALSISKSSNPPNLRFSRRWFWFSHSIDSSDLARISQVGGKMDSVITIKEDTDLRYVSIWSIEWYLCSASATDVFDLSDFGLIATGTAQNLGPKLIHCLTSAMLSRWFNNVDLLEEVIFDKNSTSPFLPEWLPQSVHIVSDPLFLLIPTSLPILPVRWRTLRHSRRQTRSKPVAMNYSRIEM